MDSFLLHRKRVITKHNVQIQFPACLASCLCPNQLPALLVSCLVLPVYWLESVHGCRKSKRRWMSGPSPSVVWSAAVGVRHVAKLLRLHLLVLAVLRGIKGRGEDAQT